MRFIPDMPFPLILLELYGLNVTDVFQQGYLFLPVFLIIHIVASCLLSIFLLRRMTVFSTYFPYLFFEIIVEEKHISCMYIMYLKLMKIYCFLRGYEKLDQFKSPIINSPDVMDYNESVFHSRMSYS